MNLGGRSAMQISGMGEKSVVVCVRRLLAFDFDLAGKRRSGFFLRSADRDI